MQRPLFINPAVLVIVLLVLGSATSVLAREADEGGRRLNAETFRGLALRTLARRSAYSSFGNACGQST
jgi:hypothetical protein